MNKKNAYKFCYGASILLILGFIIQVIIDYGVYSSTLNSAPFYLWIIVDSLYFLLPALIFGVIGLILQRKVHNSTE